MKPFGKKEGGGRRKNARLAAPVPAVVETLTSYNAVAILDVALEGVRIRGEELPGVGVGVMIKSGSVEAFGTIAWSDGDERGIHFDAPLTRSQLAFLRYDGALTRQSGLTVEERMAVAAWAWGLAR